MEPEQKLREPDVPASAVAAREFLGPEQALTRAAKYQTSGYPVITANGSAPTAALTAPPADLKPVEVPVRPRRSREETRRLALEIIEQNPGILMVDVAARLEVTDRWLREVMNPTGA